MPGLRVETASIWSSTRSGVALSVKCRSISWLNVGGTESVGCSGAAGTSTVGAAASAGVMSGASVGTVIGAGSGSAASSPRVATLTAGVASASLVLAVALLASSRPCNPLIASAFCEGAMVE